MSCEDARKKKNPKNKLGYSKILVHYESVLCGSTSMYGLSKTKNVEKVTCITCKRLLKNRGKLK